MLLQCGTAEFSGAGARGAAWLQPGVLESVVELNERSLALLAEQAQAQGAAAGLLLRQVNELWHDLDAAGRRRAAAA